MKSYKFEVNNRRWYVVLPEWTGTKAELEMVCGADTMLDIIAEGESYVTLTLSLEPFEGAVTLEKIADNASAGGADYILKEFGGIQYNLEMWLCDVTSFVFGHLPQTIYLAKHGF